MCLHHIRVSNIWPGLNPQQNSNKTIFLKNLSPLESLIWKELGEPASGWETMGKDGSLCGGAGFLLETCCVTSTLHGSPCLTKAAKLVC